MEEFFDEALATYPKDQDASLPLAQTTSSIWKLSRGEPTDSQRQAFVIEYPGKP
jgi:hypothetical protein